MFSLIIVDYCSMNKTVKFVKHFKEKMYDNNKLQVVIVDNSDTNIGMNILNNYYGEYEEVKVVETFEVYLFISGEIRIAYCWTGENLGYAKGNNLGTKISDYIFHSPYYIISNNDLRLDVLFDWNDFKKIFEDNSEIAVIGPKIIGIDGKVQSPHKKISAFKRLILYYWFNRWPFRWKPDYDYTNESKKCYRVMGCFMIIRADAFQIVDRFDENTFMFAEEPILSERLFAKGYTCFFYDDYTVVHEHGASIKKVKSFKKTEQWSFDSICYYYKKYLNTSIWLINIAKLNFKIYIFITSMKISLKRFLKNIK